MAPIQLTVDSVLLAQLRDGDEKAFVLVYDKNYRKIYQFANSLLKNKEQSEEILQETFLNVWINRERLDIHLPIEPLLFTICKRLVLDAFRKATSTSKHLAHLFQMMADEDNGTEENIIFSDLMRFTESVIAELPKQQQTVFRLNKFEGRSYEEIGQQLNISKNTVKNHLIVAVKSLKTQLDGHGIWSVLLVLLLKFLK
ncbi:RNA polymerase sigma factor [Pedobacter sp. AW31-3R]|uniref:RNA polymerase sigma factor n=1 Tax=Pedobacter sp. AW31-3R TaxID=3445781 RepID=UPI003FA18375